METHEDTLEEDLARYLDSLGREDSYRVDAVLKEGPLETTQRVFFMGRSGAELGPFVRKYLSAESGLGGAYEEVLAAQRRGVALPHLPRILECYRRDERIVVVMECVRGETLAARVARAEGPYERLVLLARVFPELCDAVSELHERLSPPVIHRDLKPETVMVSDAGVTLIDLGIARAFRQGGERDTTHFGTRAYAPPEQFGFGQTDARSDVYALGMLLFFCAAGREPVARDRERGFVDAGVPEPLCLVIVRATQLDPAARYATVRELRDALVFALGDVTRGRESSPTEEPPSFEPARPSPGALLARVPRWLGAVWNLAVLSACGLCIMGCVMGFVQPTPENARWPVWYRFFSYLVFLMPAFVIACYLMLDRRPLRREIPLLAQLTVGRETRVGLLAILGLLVLWILASLVARV